MKIKTADFATSAPDLRECPRSERPEFAFIGRSNVGKSSLINLLTGVRDLAKVSSTPGKTQLINFFTINGTWSLVDLPGYGYAKVNLAARADFNEAVADYIEKREQLRHVFVLIDSRIPPQKIDLHFIEWLAGRQVPWSIVFTKADKLSVSQVRTNVAAIQQALAATGVAAVPASFVTSAKTKTGRGEILAAISRMLEAR